ncbi:tRNA (adenine(58)-n(1))-methyltransferase non-catalytic subunit trm6 [Anaeramoeba flamelloides]|uniref:tRNA (adenine(58)-N(1))-methyltransferase non-catalytic subunit TRM6 n=1 Tax=Anaeramoeba flamelloides TaxID=1746091 RepID=A0AAV7Z482_9EUKA|nr:tRNA (adenine(58)-n(1))-methyltransferase non-catalytic subunit trm6 [Anaeramoeba flamelloides]
MGEIVKENEYIFLKFNNGLTKIYTPIKGTRSRIRKKIFFSFDKIIGLPYGSIVKYEEGDFVRINSIPNYQRGTLDTTHKERTKGNELTHQKYRKKIEKKILIFAVILKCTTKTISEYYYTTKPQIINFLRYDTLSRLILYSQIFPGAIINQSNEKKNQLQQNQQQQKKVYIVFDDCGGIITGSLLERLKIVPRNRILFKNSQEKEKEKDKEKKKTETKTKNEEKEILKEKQKNKEMKIEILEEEVIKNSNEKEKEKEKKQQNSKMPENTVDSNIIILRVFNCENSLPRNVLDKYNFTNEFKSKHLLNCKLCWLLDILGISKCTTKEKKSDLKHQGDQTSNYILVKNLLDAVEMKVESLVIASTEFYIIEIFHLLFPLLRGACPFVLYSPYLQLLTQIFHYIKKEKIAIKFSMTETFMRKYQVYENMTHPKMATEGVSGYILKGFRLLKIEN